ncbi:MAG TPA: MBL fold metallo-hydrolase [Streptosporangiaceae bacterium]|jgi:glyoxylase-like metal-dependent hydrolase (beta-lactamase superfamily II)/rhodanese-related sulfurtransferase|nr:MBL fold metallo-hydrolase [Streptosporangiaceae bacterium]
MHEVVTIETTGLGDRSYLAHDGTTAVVVDPQRDIDRVRAAADTTGVTITHVLETHIHNDYVTGGLALAEAAGAHYVVAGSEDVGFDRTAVGDGDQLGAGSLGIRVMATPGHTPGHLSYVLSDGADGPVAVFTGGSMLFGAVGRTDLISPADTEPLTRAQYRSVRRLAAELPDQVAVYPTHGFGSFCSATPTTGGASTIGAQRLANLALTSDEDEFAKDLVAGLTAYPRYYAHMGPANRRGPAAPDLTAPRRAGPAELSRRIDNGEWVVDLRRRRAFAASHLSGTISVELGDPFATYLGWTMPWGQPLTLIGDHQDQVAEACRQLVRIGVDHLAAAAAGPHHELADGRTGRYQVRDFSALAVGWPVADRVVLDVRRPDEWQAGHLTGAVHIPFWELERRAAEVPPGEVWVHCASGFRASIGASLLDRAGRQVVHVDDDWEHAAPAGLPITTDG